MIFDRWARWIESWAKPLTRLMSSIGAIFLFLMVFWVTADVCLRFAFNRPILGTYEMIEYGMVFWVFLAFGFGQFNRAHIRVPVVVERFGVRGLAAMDAVTGVVVLVIVAIMCWGAVLQSQSMQSSHVTSAVLLVPKWPFQIVTAIGLVAFFIAKVAHVLECLAVAVSKSVAATVSVEETEEFRVT